jgi:uncharacterized protein (TIGR03435 family)
MPETNDIELLQRYAREGAEDAFAVLVTRHLNLVYSVALRKTSNSDAAEEITQVVFIILARKADRLRENTILSAWLYQTTRLTAASFLRTEMRRARRELEACMETPTDKSESNEWPQVGPLLEDAMGQLGDNDRAAVVLRFFEKKSFQEVGAAFGASENAAKKRVGRALEKLRKSLAKRGVISTSAIIADSISAHSVQAAPIALAKSVTAIAIAKGAVASGSSLTLIKGALKLMAWTKAKTAVLVGIGAILVTGTATVAVKKIATSKEPAIYEEIFNAPDGGSLDKLEKAPPILIVRPTRYPNKGSGIWDTHGRGVFVGASLSDLVAWAYGENTIRIILPDDAPNGKYDYLATLPNRQNEALREELKKQFGLIARRKVQPTDVLILQANNPGKLNSFRTKGGPFACYGEGGEFDTRYFTNAPLSLLAAQIVEGYFKKPCIDRTPPKLKYDFSLRWKVPAGLKGNARLNAIQPEIEEQLQQLGLEIVPKQEPIEMLVVEQAK